MTARAVVNGGDQVQVQVAVNVHVKVHDQVNGQVNGQAKESSPWFPEALSDDDDTDTDTGYASSRRSV